MAAAWPGPAGSPRTILDVGTGAGLLALAAAERWPDADRRSRIVFIVRDLDRAAVEESWRGLATDEHAERA